MFGLFRLVLASLVALTYFGFETHGISLGGPAVISFYMLSGVLMQRQFGKFQTQGKATSTFLIDRFLRVAPTYWAVLLLVVASLGGHDLIANFTLLPLNYADFTGIETLIFPAWSLAAEVHFYLLLPLLASCNARTLKIVMWASLAIFALAPFLPHNTFWSYYGIPGVLFVFVAGMLYAREENLRSLFLEIFALMMLFSIGKLMKAPVPSGINIMVCFGLMIAILIIPRLDRLPQKNWDTQLGILTFPLFLCHTWVISISGVSNMAVLLGLSLLTSLLLAIVIERPADTFRYWVRKRRQNKDDYK